LGLLIKGIEGREGVECRPSPLPFRLGNVGKVFLACHEEDTHAIINEGPPTKTYSPGGQFGHPCSERPWNPGAHILVIPTTNTKPTTLANWIIV